MLGFLLTLAKYAAYATILVGLVISGASLYEGVPEDTRDQILQNITENPEDIPDAMLTMIAYDYITPSLMEERIGDPEKRTWLIEDLPFPSSRDIFPLFFLIWLPIIAFGKYWLASSTDMKTSLTRIGIIILLLLILTLIGWVLIKTLAYHTMNSSATEIGVDTQLIQEVRQAESDKNIDIYGISGILTLFAVFGAVLLIALLQRKKNAS